MFDAAFVILLIVVAVALLASRRDVDVKPERGRFQPYEPRLSQQKRRRLERRR